MASNVRREANEDRLRRRRERDRNRRQRETSEERRTRLARRREYDRNRRAEWRLAASQSEREERLSRRRECDRARRQNESEEERQTRLARLREYARGRRTTVRSLGQTITTEPGQRQHYANHLSPSENINLDTSEITERLQQFHAAMATLANVQCDVCLERFPSVKADASGVCNRCCGDAEEVKLYSAVNDMDPGAVPPELGELSQVEEMLISRVLPIMSIYRLPHGQYGYSGHILNVPQNVTQFLDHLPRCPTTLDIVIVRKQGVGETHKDFRVRRSVVLRALQWLIVNNKYYNDVTINHDTLSMLPNDSQLTNLVSISVSLDSVVETPGNQDSDPYNAYIPSTFVPATARSFTEQEMIQQSIMDPLPSLQHVDWPSTTGPPVNEFTTEGYISCAFPSLFPTGRADFLAPRQRMVTIGNYFKHLMLYHDQRFAKHPRFRYFALNTEMRHRALQTGRIYVRQNPDDGHLSVDELREMVQHGSDALSNRVLHFGASLRGTRQFWQKQKNRLTAMVDTLGLPTVFFTLSAADLQWPELADLLDVEESESSTRRSRAVIENPCLADWFFYHRVMKFMSVFFVDVLNATDYWLRFEYQHRGSPHIHGIAWLQDAPDVQNVMMTNDLSVKEQLITYIDCKVCTINPAVLRDGSNVSDAPPPKINPHICNKRFSEVEDYQQDLNDLIATCQRHTRCSAAYCLRTKNGVQKCRFDYPKPLQPETTIITDEESNEPTLITARNDGLINSYNPHQLLAWRGNVDMQYCVSKRRVIEYIAKYATKCEPRSETMKQVYTSIVRNLRDDSSALQVIQKLLINSVGERDFSAQETCHLLLYLPLIKSTRDHVILSLDGSREVHGENPENSSNRATVPSILDHYVQRPHTAMFEEMTLLHFAQNFSMPKDLGTSPKQHKMKIVSVRPYCSLDPNGPKFEQYSQQKLMLHVPFREINQLKGTCETFSQAYSEFLQSANIPVSLEDDIRRLSNQGEHQDEDTDEEDISYEQHREMEEWMLICHRNADHHTTVSCDDDHDWSASTTAYTNIDELPTFITRHRQAAQQHQFTTAADPCKLQGRQLAAYNLVKAHMDTDNPTPLRMVISGTAGTGKSYLINCLRLLLQDKVRVVAPTGVAAFNIDGNTLHSLLCLPVKGEFKDLQGEQLKRLQQSLETVQYIIIDEMSMVGRKLFGQVDRRLRQIFPQHSCEVLGGCSCLLFGDFGQLPPVMDLPLYTTSTSSPLSDIGSSSYRSFSDAAVLDQIMRQSGDDPSQILFRNILLRLRNCEVTEADWRTLMTRTLSQVSDTSMFDNAIHLFPTIEAVVEHNINKLHACGQPVGTIKAVHTGPNASKASSDDAGGLQPILCIAKGARVMLSANLWVDVGLVNGAMGTVQSLCYHEGKAPPELPIVVTVLFDKYSGPTLPDGTVPIPPLRRSWSTSGSHCSRLQLPLKLAWAVTIHKAQGLTLNKLCVDIGKKEFSAGLTFVAISRVRCLTDLLLKPSFSFQRLKNLAKSRRIEERKDEEKRLKTLDAATFTYITSQLPTMPFTNQPLSESIQCSITPSCSTIGSVQAANPHLTTPSPPDLSWQMDTDALTTDSQLCEMTTPSPPDLSWQMDTHALATDSQLCEMITPDNNDVQAADSPLYEMTTPSPPNLSSWMDVQATPSPPSHWMNEATPSPPSHQTNKDTPSPPPHWMNEDTPSPPPHWMNEDTPSPPSQ